MVVKTLPSESPADICRLIYELLFNLGYNADDLLILFYSNRDCGKLISTFDGETRNLFECGQVPRPNKGLVTTYHSAKGLESKICICTAIDVFNESSELDRRLMYVGMTRASKRLVLHSFEQQGGFCSDIDGLLNGQ